MQDDGEMMIVEEFSQRRSHGEEILQQGHKDDDGARRGFINDGGVWRWQRGVDNDDVNDENKEENSVVAIFSWI